MTAATSSSIHASWQLPPENSSNGIIKGFKLLYKKKDSSASFTSLIITNNGTLNKTLTGLSKFTQYEFQVLAYTSAGDGPKSHVKVQKTKEDGKNNCHKQKVLSLICIHYPEVTDLCDIYYIVTKSVLHLLIVTRRGGL